MSQLVLDIVSDLMSRFPFLSLNFNATPADDTPVLAIPVHIIWQVRIRWTQKIALGCTLCLTMVLVAVTIIRWSGVLHHESVDPVWSSYWQLISAEVGIILTAMTAFRALFVSHSKKRASPNSPRTSGVRAKARDAIKRAVSSGSWPGWVGKKMSTGATSSWWSTEKEKEKEKEKRRPLGDLPEIPGAQMTGIRTFIDGEGQDCAWKPEMGEGHNKFGDPARDVEGGVLIMSSGNLNRESSIRVKKEIWTSTEDIP
jgi:hypothetical protein